MKTIHVLAISACLCGWTLSAATVAYYEFDGTGTAAVGSPITDSTGNHNGTVVGGDLVYGNDPLVGGYLSFDLDPDRVVIPGAPELLFGMEQGYTMEVVFRTTMTTAVGSLLSKGADVSNPDSQYWMRYAGNGRVTGLIEGVDNTTEDSAATSTATPVNDGKWHRVALVFNGTNSPKRLEIYLDGVFSGADASVGTAGIVGGADSDPLILGEFASLVATRSFAGDIAAVRLSDAPLTPADFLQVSATYITGMMPVNGAIFLPPSTVAQFVVKSPTIGVAATGIQVTMNGENISGQLTFTGSNSDRTVTLPPLNANQRYRLQITVTDLASNVITETSTFNTFVNNLVFVEGEDYNFNGGQFIDNPQLASSPGANNYLDRLGIEGTDYHQTNAPTSALYRIGDQVGTAVSQDALRQAYLAAQATDPGVADYDSREFGNTEWLNYTRTFPDNTWRVYVRIAKGGTVPIVLRLDEVTAGSSSSSQTLAPIGFFRRLPTGANNVYDLVPLTDALGQEIALRLSGVKTLRLAMVSGTATANLNYMLFVPGATQPPFVASVAPAAGAGNETANPVIQAAVRNGTTSVQSGSIALGLDGATVSATVTPVTTGADVSYNASSLALGWHTAVLRFSDGSASYTNQWQFYVANQAVRGYWKFDEQAAATFSSTNSGAILDSSGNLRHGTASAATMPYVTGSFNYGNTRALHFSTAPDRIVVSDGPGNFNFTGSFTFEALIRTAGSSTSAAILAKNGLSDGEGEYWWRLPGDVSGVQRVGVNGNFITGTNVLNDGLWHHVAVVYDQSTAQISLYADYVLETQTNGIVFDRPVGRPADLHLGSFIGGGSDFDGDIDFIRISDGVLSVNQFVAPTIALQPLLKGLLPVNGARNVSLRPTIEAEFQNRDTAVVLNTLKLFVDGADVTASAVKTGDTIGAKISYTPATGLATGLHTVVTTFNDTAAPANSWTNSWTFTVLQVVPVLGSYQFNEKAPGNAAETQADAILDGSGRGHHATAAAALSYVTGSPAYGNSSALQFVVGGAGVATPVTIPDPSGVFNFATTQSITMEAIIKTTTIGENNVGALIAKQGASPGEYWWRINAAGTQSFWVNNGSGSRTAAGVKPVNDGEWHHMAAVFDGIAQQVRVYVDYKLDGSAAAVYAANDSPIGNAKDVWIGAFQNLDREFAGDIDAVRISGEALDPSWFIPLGGMAAPVQIINLVKTAGNFSFSFVTESGRSYVVQGADSMSGTWSDLETLPGDGNLKQVSYAAAGNQKYYRVKVQ